MARPSASPLADFAGDVVRSVRTTSDRLGLREWVRCLDYFRCIEYPLVVEALEPRAGLTLLDMGCGTGPFALYLAHRLGIRVQALDLDAACVAWQARGARRLGLRTADFSAIEGDSRNLPQSDSTFDMVLNLGSIEHIPGDGDSLAAEEMSRVLKPGGRAIVTVPYGVDFLEIASGPHVSGFERRYDDRALRERLVGPSGLMESGRSFFGEPGFAASTIWYGIPRILKLPFRRLGPHLSRRFLSRLRSDDRHRACGVCLILDKDL